MILIMFASHWKLSLIQNLPLDCFFDDIGSLDVMKLVMPAKFLNHGSFSRGRGTQYTNPDWLQWKMNGRKQIEDIIKMWFSMLGPKKQPHSSGVCAQWHWVLWQLSVSSWFNWPRGLLYSWTLWSHLWCFPQVHSVHRDQKCYNMLSGSHIKLLNPYFTIPLKFHGILNKGSFHL